MPGADPEDRDTDLPREPSAEAPAPDAQRAETAPEAPKAPAASPRVDVKSKVEIKPKDEPREQDEARGNTLGRFARRLLDREHAPDVKGALGSLMDTGDRAKSEMVKMAARELRHYLAELKLKEDLLELATSHSLEIKMSISLKPLADAVRASGPSDDEDEG